MLFAESLPDWRTRRAVAARGRRYRRRHADSCIVRQWNKAGLNRVTKHIAPWAPGMGIIIHRGRRSGRLYQTPVNVFSVKDGYVFALTYGPDTDWVKNVLAAGGCELRTRGHATRLTSPRLYHDQSRRDIRLAERQVLRLLGVADFLFLQTVPPGATTTGHSDRSASG
jgi:deazaflavin-dependent oxidoreductase (nitroreductase family)